MASSSQPAPPGVQWDDRAVKACLPGHISKGRVFRDVRLGAEGPGPWAPGVPTPSLRSCCHPLQDTIVVSSLSDVARALQDSGCKDAQVSSRRRRPHPSSRNPTPAAPHPLPPSAGRGAAHAGGAGGGGEPPRVAPRGRAGDAGRAGAGRLRQRRQQHRLWGAALGAGGRPRRRAPVRSGAVGGAAGPLEGRQGLLNRAFSGCFSIAAAGRCCAGCMGRIGLSPTRERGRAAPVLLPACRCPAASQGLRAQRLAPLRSPTHAPQVQPRRGRGPHRLRRKPGHRGRADDGAGAGEGEPAEGQSSLPR